MLETNNYFFGGLWAYIFLHDKDRPLSYIHNCQQQFFSGLSLSRSDHADSSFSKFKKSVYQKTRQEVIITQITAQICQMLRVTSRYMYQNIRSNVFFPQVVKSPPRKTAIGTNLCILMSLFLYFYFDLYIVHVKS